MTGLSLYAADGHYDGAIFMSSHNSKIKAARVSRDALSDYESALNKPGIYLLLINDDTVYVGQSGLDNIFRRIKNVHTGNIDASWHTVVAFTFDDPVSSNMLLFLENGMCEYVHKNYPHCATSQPAKDKCNKQYRNVHYNLSIMDKQNCEKLLGEMKDYIACFPKGIFPASSPTSSSSGSGGSGTSFSHCGAGGSGTSGGASGQGGDQGGNQGNNEYHTAARSSKAEGRLLSNGHFILSAGCFITPLDPTPTCPASALARLEAEKDKLDGNKVIADIEFKSPSGAACFVLKASANGNDVWKTADGVKMGDLNSTSSGGSISTSGSGNLSNAGGSDGGDDGNANGNDDEIPIEIGALGPLYCTGRGANAVAYMYPDGTFILKAGSHITAEGPTEACPSGALKRLDAEKDNLRGTEVLVDLKFSSASAAGNFVVKSSANGNDVWKNAFGDKLGSLR